MTDKPDRFALCLPIVLRQECPKPEHWTDARNFSDDAHDPGGHTMCGITQREYDHCRKQQGLKPRDVRQLTEAEGRDIYWRSYWLPECSQLPAGLDLVYFDEAVNAGPHAATVLLQRAIGIDADGVWGPHTVLALKGAAHDLRATIAAYTKAREHYYKSLRGFQYFGKGWIRRAEEVGSIALHMAA